MMSKIIKQYKISGKSLVVVSDESIKNIAFPLEIKQVEQFDGVLIVMLKVPRGQLFNENVFGVSAEGKILWQIEKMEYVYKDSPFTGLVCEDNCVKLLNWDGTDLYVDAFTGKILRKGYSK